MSTETSTGEIRSSFCAVATPTLVYAGPRTKAEFDLLPIQEMVGDWAPCRTTSVIKRDGREWERRIHSKTLGDFGDGVTVVFQWADERVAGGEA